MPWVLGGRSWFDGCIRSIKIPNVDFTRHLNVDMAQHQMDLITSASIELHLWERSKHPREHDSDANNLMLRKVGLCYPHQRGTWESVSWSRLWFLSIPLDLSNVLTNYGAIYNDQDWFSYQKHSRFYIDTFPQARGNLSGLGGIMVPHLKRSFSAEIPKGSKLQLHCVGRSREVDTSLQGLVTW